MLKGTDGATFGQEVRRRREGRDMTLTLLSKRAGLTINYVGSVETGKRDPSLSTVLSLANALNIRPAELFGTVKDLNPMSEEAARLFEQAPSEVQAAVLGVLHLLPASKTKTTTTPPKTTMKGKRPR